MNKYTIKDIEKGIEYLKSNCSAVYVIVEIDQLGRLELKGSDIAGNRITIIIYDEATTKMPEVIRTERL